METVISQSMLFPWVGMLEQIRLANTFVHYDDLQFSKCSFTNRVQVKTANGVRWMTVPLNSFKLGQAINEVTIKSVVSWKDRHLELLKQSFAGAPHSNDAISIAEGVYSQEYSDLGALARRSMLALAEYYGLLEDTKFVDIIDLKISGSGSQRVFDVVTAVGGSGYLTGHGARNYLDHTQFENGGIRVSYIDYLCLPYPQLHGRFTPYVSGLDLVANCGLNGIEFICSRPKHWKEYLNDSY